MSKIKITFAGGAKTPTGSNFILEVGGKKLLVDCGLYQGPKLSTPSNRDDFTYDPKSIDALFVTHAHLDHVGRIPKLVRDGFSGPIYSTGPTRDIGELIMFDSMSILNRESKHEGLEPLYEEIDIVKAMHNWHTQDYHEVLPIQTIDGVMTIRFLNAGHILGSSMIEFSLNGKKLVFTGDLGNSPSPLLPDTEKLEGVDYLIMESVYGDRNHEHAEEKVSLLKKYIVDTIARGGNLMIPAFSIERTQEMLYYINNMIENKEINPVPMYLDSPLGIGVTKIYKKYESMLNTSVQSIIKSGDDIFNFKGLTLTSSSDESKAINDDNRPKIIMAGSGMSNGGRILHHEKNYLGDAKSTLLLVGYQAVGTMGRLLEDGHKSVRIMGEDVNVRAHIEMIGGFSAHKDSKHLVEFVEDTADTLKKVFVVLGEPKSSMFLAQRLVEYYGLDVQLPEVDEVVEIEM
jgi:metallo-beta-lactamase family protein